MGLLGEIIFSALKELDKTHNDGKMTKKLNQAMKNKKIEIQKDKQRINRNVNMYSDFFAGKSNEELLNIYRNQDNSNEKRYAAGKILKERGYGN